MTRPCKVGFLFLGVPQMAIRVCLGSRCSSVRITPLRRYGGTVACRNVHRTGTGDKRGKTRPLTYRLMVRPLGLYPSSPSSILGMSTVVVGHWFLGKIVTLVNAGSIPADHLRSVRLSVRTKGFHPLKGSSILPQSTNCLIE